MKIGAAIVVCVALALAGTASAQGRGVRQGGLPGGRLSTRPGVAGVGVPGQVPGGTLGTTPGSGGLGVPGQVPGGTLSAQPGIGGVGVPGQVPGGRLGFVTVCNGVACTRLPFVPGLVVPVPAGTASGLYGAPPPPESSP